MGHTLQQNAQTAALFTFRRPLFSILLGLQKPDTLVHGYPAFALSDVRALDLVKATLDTYELDSSMFGSSTTPMMASLC
ncbi:hypothetical protein Ct61P_15076 [Colletotrichum tofieldiae]|nr:hypothetical protein Ct61P_15076 [Colletotrichum tofieldiae]